MNVDETSNFFLIYPLNLEDLGAIELEEKMKLYLPNEEFTYTQINGGIELKCTVRTGFLLNHILRSPTRILLRVSEFKCRDFPKLYQKFSKINWSNLLLGIAPEIETSSTNSRLFDSRKIEKAAIDGILEFYRRQPPKKKYQEYAKSKNKEDLPKVFLRFNDDVCTVSIDCTGKRLHLRDEKILTGHAPIRENLAYLLLTELEKNISNKNATLSLIDPMCGSGTFLLEAKNKYNITTNRSFAYQSMPLAINDSATVLGLTAQPKRFFECILGFDIDEKIVEQARKNLIDIQIQKEDIFSSKTHNISNAAVIVNPPYGIRIGSNIDSQFFENLIHKVHVKFKPIILGIIIPDEFKINFPDFCKIQNKRSFSNGGIDVSFYVLGFK